MADFYVYESIPGKEDSIKAHPHERPYPESVRSLEFKNQGKNTVEVHFDPALRAKPDPLPVPGHGRAIVDVEPRTDGIYPCWMEVVHPKCPTCGRKLKEKLRVRPHHRALTARRQPRPRHHADPAEHVRPELVRQDHRQRQRDVAHAAVGVHRFHRVHDGAAPDGSVGRAWLPFRFTRRCGPIPGTGLPPRVRAGHR